MSGHANVATLVVASGKRKPAVGGLVECFTRLGQAEWLQVLASAKVFAGLQGRDGQRGCQHRDFNLPARPATAYPRQQGHNAEGGMQVDVKIYHWQAGLAGDTYHVGAGLDGQIEPSPPRGPSWP